MNSRTLSATLVTLLAACLIPSAALAQHSAWATSSDGWVLRKPPGGKAYERFFAIGLWNVPGYTFTKSEAADSTNSNAALFLKRTAPYNIAFVPTGYSKAYMNRVIQFIGPVDFPQALNRYLDEIPQINEDKTNAPYLRMQFIRRDARNPKLAAALDQTIGRLSDLNGAQDHGWAPIDEIANGGAGDWNWPTGVGDLIYKRIREREKGTLVFTDLVGVGRGNTFLFEERYLQSHKALPPAPPYELLSQDARDFTKRPLLGFRQAHNGMAVYDFTNGSYSYRNYDRETLKGLWYENIRRCAAGFKKSGDVFGINAFRDFAALPILAGITVDALKAGAGRKAPVWLYFDGNGYAKDPRVSPEEYVKNVRCQIYTSLIHGATGVLFWNDRSKTPAVFDALEPVVREVQANAEILRMRTREQKAVDDLHVLIKSDRKNKRYVLATNTSKTSEVVLDLPQGRKVLLKPLQVYISSF